MISSYNWYSFKMTEKSSWLPRSTQCLHQEYEELHLHIIVFLIQHKDNFKFNTWLVAAYYCETVHNT